MSARRACVPLCQRRHVTVARAYDLGRTISPAHEQRVGLLLCPFDASPLAIDAQHDAVFLAGSHLCGVQHAVYPAGEVQERRDVVVVGASLDHGAQLGTELLHLQACYVLRQVPGVGANVAHAASLARLRGVGAPSGIVTAQQFDAFREPALRIFHIDEAQASQLSLGNAALHLLDGRVGRIGVSQRQGAARLSHFLFESQCLVEREGHGLVQHHVESHVQCHRSLLVVHPVWRHDGHEVHAFAQGQCRLALHHLTIVAVDALRGHVPRLARRERGLIIAAEASAHQLNVVIHQRCPQMDGADHGIPASADHAHSKFSVCHIVRL